VGSCPNQFLTLGTRVKKVKVDRAFGRKVPSSKDFWMKGSVGREADRCCVGQGDEGRPLGYHPVVVLGKLDEAIASTIQGLLEP